MTNSMDEQNNRLLAVKGSSLLSLGVTTRMITKVVQIDGKRLLRSIKIRKPRIAYVLDIVVLSTFHSVLCPQKMSFTDPLSRLPF